MYIGINKIEMRKHSNRLWAVAILLFIAFFTSCAKGDLSKIQSFPSGLGEGGVPGSNISFLSVIHAAPKIGALDIALDANRLYLNLFNYTYRVDYFRIPSGVHAFSVYQASGINTLTDKNLKLEENKYYSIFITDTLSKMDAVVFRDSSRAPGTDSVRVRFANLSPNVGKVDLYLRYGSTPIAKNIGYKQISEFVSVKAANDVVFEVSPAGERTVWAITNKMNLSNGNIYTIWTTGFISMTTDDGKIRAEAIRH